MFTVRHRLVRRNLDSVPVLESYGSLITDNNQEKDIICMLETLKNMFFLFFFIPQTAMVYRRNT